MKKSKINKPTLILIAVASIIAITIGVLLAFSPFGKSKMEVAAIKMGEAFYQDFYYDMLTRGKKPEEIGAFLNEKEYRITLEQIEKIKEIDISTVLQSIEKEKDKYDWSKTNVVIKPKMPFGKKDYDIKVNLVK